ncbi:MAG: hypothetical protein HUU22_13705 [Phycisphaerae bacterium]|nr:hypothetical protein [Phycisphaerae bacterium]NUQ47075.1 hypothetical protein [Phycisphaerae bacterium]
MSTRTILRLIACTCAVIFTPCSTVMAQSPTIWYVDADVSTNQTPDGTSWETAFPTLQQAITAAQANQDPSEEIWVARGVYTPGPTHTSTFVLKDRVAVYGGFEGIETELEQRDPDPLTNGTVLFTDITQATACDVLVTLQGDWPTNEIDSDTVLDGFTVTGARKHAIINYYSLAAFANLLVIENGSRYNVSPEEGGAILITVDSKPTFDTCIFVDNIATRGGAVAINIRSQGRFTDCYFGGNEVAVPTDTFISGGGGAIACDASQGTAVTQPRTILRRCIFENNLADACDGGAILKTGDARMDLVECQFNDNTARGHGGSYPPTEGNGGALCTLSGDVNTINCIFKGNVSKNPRGGSAPAGGGAWYCLKPCSTAPSTAAQQPRQAERQQGRARRLGNGREREVDESVTRGQHAGTAGVGIDGHRVAQSVRMALLKLKCELNCKRADGGIAGNRGRNPGAVEQELPSRAVADEHVQQRLTVAAEQVKVIQGVHVEQVSRRRGQNDVAGTRREEVDRVARRAVRRADVERTAVRGPCEVVRARGVRDAEHRRMARLEWIHHLIVTHDAVLTVCAVVNVRVDDPGRNVDVRGSTPSETEKQQAATSRQSEEPHDLIPSLVS